MIFAPHQYSIVLSRQDGSSLAPAAPVAIDWEPVEEEIKLRRLRAPELGPWVPGDVTCIAPLWHEQIGEPCIGGVSIASRRGAANNVAPVDPRLAFTLPTAFFADIARKLADPLVAAGTLKTGDKFLYFVLATETPAPAGAPSAPGACALEICERYTPPPLVDGALDDAAIAQLPLVDGTHADPDDLPVIIPRHVLRASAELTLRHAARETGGVLVGHLLEPVPGRRLTLVIADHIPAVAAREELASLTFTPETWTAARAEIDRRGASLILAGWFHSHPAKFWGADQAATAQARPAAAAQAGGAQVFSRDDALLHRTVFGGAHNIALVATHGESAIEFALYGWRRGMIRRRAYRLSEH